MSGAIIDFEDELSRHGQLLAREAVLAELRAWIIGEQALRRGCVLLLGSPGIGKSAILAHILKKTLPGPTAPHHIIRRGNEGWDRPEAVVQNLCAQIEEIFPGVDRMDVPLERRLGELLKRVSKDVLGPENRRLILVIDGLDEVATDTLGQGYLHRFFPNVLPAGVVLLCASRPSHHGLHWTERLGGLHRLNLDDPKWSPSNKDACRVFWEHHGARFAPPLDRAFIDAAVQRAGGNLLHAVMLREWLENQPPERRVARNIPEGLDSFLEQIWSDLHQLDPARCALVIEGLGVACVAREALPAYLFSELLGWSATSDVEAFLRATRPFLLKELAHWHDEESAYRLYHHSFREFVASQLGTPKLREHHRQIAARLATWLRDENNKAGHSYALRHTVAHWLEAGDIHQAQTLCADVDYLKTKCRALGVAAIERDLEATIRGSEGDVSVDLSAVLAAVRAEANRLTADPASLPLLLYNRLRCTGWPAEQIERVLRFRAGAPPLRLLHPVRLGATLLRTLPGHDKAVVACIATRDGSHLLSASADGTLRLWSVESGDCVAVLAGHTDQLTACAATPDGRSAITTSVDAKVRIWDLAARVCSFELDNEGRWSTACAVSPDGRHIVIGSDDGSIRVLDSSSHKPTMTLLGHTDYVTACLVTPDNKRVVSASRDESVRVWDLASGECLFVLRRAEPPDSRDVEKQRWITSIAFTADGRQVVAASEDGSLTRWELSSGELVHSFALGEGRIDACTVTHDGVHLVCGLKNGDLVVLDLVTSRRVLCVKAHADAVSTCAATPDGRRIVSASSDRSLKLWELGVPTIRTLEEGHAAPVIACGFTPDGAAAVSASADRTIKVWNRATGACSATLEGDGDMVAACCAVSADRLHVAAGASDGRLVVWRVATGELVSFRKVHTDRVSGCAFTLRGQILSASHDGTLRLWDPSRSADGAVIGRHGDAVEGFAATPDGSFALSVSRGSGAKLWSIAKRRCEPLPVGAGFLCGALTPDGRRVVLGRESGMLEMHDLGSGRWSHSQQRHERRILGCALSPDGKRVISASEDETLKTWDFDTGKLLGTLYGVRLFRCVTMTKDWICAGDEEGNLWILASGAAAPQEGARQEPAKRAPKTTPVRRSTAEPVSSAVQSRSTTFPKGKRTTATQFIDTKPSSARAPIARARHAHLRDVLADLYTTVEEIRRFLSEADLDVRRVALTGAAWDIWESILTEAHRLECLDRVVRCARENFPSNSRLAAAARELGFD
ncbi:effector-associated domain EAD1-containing protein [Sorangium sp. So ce1128]